MKTILRRALVLVMTAAMFLTMVPFCLADGSGSKNDFMDMFDDRVAAPKTGSILDTPREMYVTSKYGYCIYVLSKSQDNSAKLYRMPEGSKVTVYAIENGYALGMDTNSRVGGWMKYKLLTDSSDYTVPTLNLNKLDSRIARPKNDSYLDEPQQMYVTSKYGNCIYVLAKAQSNATKLGRMDEGTVVTVYAVQNGYALGVDEDSRFGGWMSYSLLSDCYYSGPSPLDLKTAPSSVEKPYRENYLDEYETMYVSSRFGVCIYLMNSPDEKTNEIIGKIAEAEPVTVLARRNGFCCVIVDNTGEIGWCSASLLKYVY